MVGSEDRVIFVQASPPDGQLPPTLSFHQEDRGASGTHGSTEVHTWVGLVHYGKKIMITITWVNIEITIIQRIVFGFENMIGLFRMSPPKNTVTENSKGINEKEKCSNLHIVNLRQCGNVLTNKLPLHFDISNTMTTFSS